jgi:hypothetical protein
VRRHALGPTAVLLVLACGEPTVPTRTPAYGFDDAMTGDVFRWPGARLPVRVWVDQRGALPRLVNDGLRAWETRFLYGEFRGVTVSDSAAADVIVRWSGAVPPDVPPDPGPPVFACTGLTQFSVDATNTLDDYVRVEVGSTAGFSDAQVAACLVRVATHELGHVLGILQHSPATADLMYPTPGVGEPSDGDRRTVEVLYHTEPTIAPKP